MATTSKKPVSKKPKTAKKVSPATAKKTVTKKATKTSVKSTKVTAAKSAPVIKDSTKKMSLKNVVPTQVQKLRTWNISMAVLHAVQAAAVVLLAKAGTGMQPVTTSYLTQDSLASTPAQPVLVSATRHLFDVNLVWLIAAFFIMSAIAHASIATWYRARYEANLSKGINKARWIEYSLSASTMMVAIGLIAGIFDVSTLVMMFGLTAVMNLCGLAMELVNQNRPKVSWIAYIIGCIAGILPWIVYVIYIVGSSKLGDGNGPPTFVYFILVSIFLAFNSFAYVMLKQYQKKGKWSDYLYGERAYMVLSLVAKSLLAWQVFAGILRP